jgi:hypothetical protein
VNAENGNPLFSKCDVKVFEIDKISEARTGLPWSLANETGNPSSKLVVNESDLFNTQLYIGPRVTNTLL